MAQGQIRIIGGQWRGRKLTVPTIPNLRPTPDRVRETLFNWLAPVIQGSYCLDLFAGSGALGFEALSRGAAHVVMVDHSREVVKLLREELQVFNAIAQADIYRAEVPAQLKLPQKKFDIVFLDPPFHENILFPTCFYLEENEFLANNTLIYIEAKAALQPADIPVNWEVIKSKITGLVAYHLVVRRC